MSGLSLYTIEQATYRMATERQIKSGGNMPINFDAAWLRELRAAEQVIASQEDAELVVMLAQAVMPVEAVREIDWMGDAS